MSLIIQSEDVWVTNTSAMATVTNNISLDVTDNTVEDISVTDNSFAMATVTNNILSDVSDNVVEDVSVTESMVAYVHLDSHADRRIFLRTSSEMDLFAEKLRVAKEEALNLRITHNPKKKASNENEFRNEMIVRSEQVRRCVRVSREACGGITMPENVSVHFPLRRGRTRPQKDTRPLPKKR